MYLNVPALFTVAQKVKFTGAALVFSGGQVILIYNSVTLML
jgi:hypothetical protein